jgi:hypothetical protein
MAEHRFKIGETVFFRPRPSRRIVPLNHPYRITRRLPEARGVPQYQIRCTVTDGEFEASESELRTFIALNERRAYQGSESR